jgi:hypothetical protein
MQYNPSPRDELRKDTNAAKAHHALVENPILRRHFEITLMEMQRRAGAGTDATNFNFCASSHLRMLGAQEFADLFLNLVETPVPQVKTDTTNLLGNISKLTGKN